MRRRSFLQWLVSTSGMLAAAAMPVVGRGCGLCIGVWSHPGLPIWSVERSRGSVARHNITDPQGTIPF